MSFSRKLKQGIICHLLDSPPPPPPASRKCDLCDWNLNPPPLRNFSCWLISSKLDRIIEGLKVVSSYKFHEKQQLDRRERSKPRFRILFGLLFGRPAHPASWQGIRSIRRMLPNQAELALSPKQLVVMRCGKQFLKSERNKFLCRTGLPSVLALVIMSLMG